MCQIWSFDQICLLFSFQGMKHTYQICILTLCTSSALRNGFLDAHHMQNSMFYKKVWQPPALPCRLQHSTIGRTDLHRRVRDGNGCCLRTHRHQTKLSKNIQSFGKPPRCSALRAPASLQTFASRCACAPLYAHVCTLVKASYMLVRARHPLGFSSLFSSHENPTETQPLLLSLERR